MNVNEREFDAVKMAPPLLMAELLRKLDPEIVKAPEEWIAPPSDARLLSKVLV